MNQFDNFNPNSTAITINRNLGQSGWTWSTLPPDSGQSEWTWSTRPLDLHEVDNPFGLKIDGNNDLTLEHVYISKTPSMPKINDVIINDPAVVVFWSDGDETVGKSMKGEKFSPEVGLAMAISRKYYKTMVNSDCPRAAFKNQIKNAKDYSKKTKDKKSRSKK